jgi:hypothetical protein
MVNIPICYSNSTIVNIYWHCRKWVYKIIVNRGCYKITYFVASYRVYSPRRRRALWVLVVVWSPHARASWRMKRSHTQRRRVCCVGRRSIYDDGSMLARLISRTFSVKKNVFISQQISEHYFWAFLFSEANMTCMFQSFSFSHCACRIFIPSRWSDPLCLVFTMHWQESAATGLIWPARHGYMLLVPRLGLTLDTTAGTAS